MRLTGMHPSVQLNIGSEFCDVYNVTTFDEMHNFHLGWLCWTWGLRRDPRCAGRHCQAAEHVFLASENWRVSAVLGRIRVRLQRMSLPQVFPLGVRRFCDDKHHDFRRVSTTATLTNLTAEDHLLLLIQVWLRLLCDTGPDR